MNGENTVIKPGKTPGDLENRELNLMKFIVCQKLDFKF
jgi:hypothetical protein